MESNAAGADPEDEDTEDQNDESVNDDSDEDAAAVDAEDEDDSDEDEESDEDSEDDEDEPKAERSLAEIGQSITAKGIDSVTASELVRYQKHIAAQNKRIADAGNAARAAREHRPTTEANLLKAIGEIIPIEDKTKGELLQRKVSEQIGPAFDAIESAVQTVVLDDIATSLLTNHVPDNAQNRAVIASIETWDDVVNLIVGVGSRKSEDRIKQLETEVEALKETNKSLKNQAKAANGKERGSPKTRGAPNKGGITKDAFMNASPAERVKMMRANPQEVLSLQ